MPHGIKGSTPQAKCHPDRKAKGHGLCDACYHKHRYSTLPDWKKYVNKRNKENYRKKMSNPKSRVIENLKSALRQREPKYREANRRSKMKLKAEVLTHYGKSGKLQCCWEKCEVKDLDMLTLDHVNNDGSKCFIKGKTKRVGGTEMYRWARISRFPKGFQTLCCNHQMKKELLRKRTIYEQHISNR